MRSINQAPSSACIGRCVLLYLFFSHVVCYVSRGKMKPQLYIVLNPGVVTILPKTLN